jgi:hypothetical protein
MNMRVVCSPPSSQRVYVAHVELKRRNLGIKTTTAMRIPNEMLDVPEMSEYSE